MPARLCFAFRIGGLQMPSGFLQCAYDPPCIPDLPAIEKTCLRLSLATSFDERFGLLRNRPRAVQWGRGARALPRYT